MIIYYIVYTLEYDFVMFLLQIKEFQSEYILTNNSTQ